MTTPEKFTVQLISVSTKKHGEARITFACEKSAFTKLEDLRTLEVPLLMWLEGAEKEKINMTIASIVSSSNGQYPRKFVVETPENEKIRVGELSTLVGSELTIYMTLLVEPLPLD